jgi:ring-1,2-phenylacetyl-CoA epoxidase subunit PaaA
VKVDKEETFHLRHGENWCRKIAQSAEGRDELQRAVDWMFLLTVEWFGLPDNLKRHGEQLNFGFKGQSNDELRQTWMSTAVPLAIELGLDVPAHRDENSGSYVIDCPFPAQFDAENKRWLLEEGAVSWDGVQSRWKDRGPMNEQYVETIQRGKRGLERLIAQA